MARIETVIDKDMVLRAITRLESKPYMELSEEDKVEYAQLTKLFLFIKELEDADRDNQTP